MENPWAWTSVSVDILLNLFNNYIFLVALSIFLQCI